ncbi:MAG TPA: methyltransferase domain-containing protein [Streptosporangiaceae bacterium]|jgi:ubiquinone/menaquinone biosynthesis C-methylase UbiE
MPLGRLMIGAHNPGTPGITLEHGHSYDLFATFFFGGRRNRVFSRLAVLSGARPGDRVLDVGCGTGYLARRLAAVVTPGGSVAGVDASSAMVERARQASSGACTFAVGVAERLDFGDGAFDVVTSSLMLHHLPPQLRGQALAEMHRVLPPGGRVLIAEFRPPRSSIGRHLAAAVTTSEMQHTPVAALQPILREAGFEPARSGDLHPWISYACAVRP